MLSNGYAVGGWDLVGQAWVYPRNDHAPGGEWNLYCGGYPAHCPWYSFVFRSGSEWKSSGEYQGESIEDQWILQICQKPLLLSVSAWLRWSDLHGTQLDPFDLAVFVLGRNDHCSDPHGGEVAEGSIWTGVYRLLQKGKSLYSLVSQKATQRQLNCVAF